MMNTTDIIRKLGGNAAVARRLGIGPSGVSEMKRRNSIPVKYWAGLLEMAREQGEDGITTDALVRIHADEVAA